MIAPSNGLAVENIPGIRDIGSSDREGVVCRLRQAAAYTTLAYCAVEALVVVVVECSELPELQARRAMQRIPCRLRARRAI